MNSCGLSYEKGQPPASGVRFERIKARELQDLTDYDFNSNEIL
jgi:hypothetical protein